MSADTINVDTLSFSYKPTANEKNELKIFIQEAKEYFQENYHHGQSIIQKNLRLQEFLRRSVLIFLRHQKLRRVQKHVQNHYIDENGSTTGETSSDDNSSTDSWVTDAAYVSKGLIDHYVNTIERFLRGQGLQEQHQLQFKHTLRDLVIDFFSNYFHYQESKVDEACHRELISRMDVETLKFFNQNILRAHYSGESTKICTNILPSLPPMSTTYDHMDSSSVSECSEEDFYLLGKIFEEEESFSLPQELFDLDLDFLLVDEVTTNRNVAGIITGGHEDNYGAMELSALDL